MFLAFLLSVQTVPAPAPDQPVPPRLQHCLELADSDAAAAEADAIKWRGEGGGFLARQCLGVAYAKQLRWDASAAALQDAALEAEGAHDARAANFWALSGNAWLAAGEPAKARAVLDAALVANALTGVAAGEAYLDRARAKVALGDDEGARADIDHALTLADSDPLAWLLSATLARKDDDAARAQKDVAEALKRSPDDASVQLEAGHVAGWNGNYVDARAALNRVIELAPGSPQAEEARKLIAKLPAEH